MRVEEIFERIVDLARRRVRSGVVSERGLARLCGVSQPHIHNVLKNLRALSPASADRLLEALGVTAADLLWTVPEEIETEVRAAPMLAARLGAGNTLDFEKFRGFTPLPASLLRGLVEPVTVRLGPDLAMPSSLKAGDIALLDQNPVVRAAPAEPFLWVVSEPTGTRVRYVKVVAGRLQIGADVGPLESREWRLVRHGVNVLEIVRARIVWIGREMEAPEAGPTGTAGARH